MANYMGTSRTNYFRVKNEDAYNKLMENLTCEDNIHDFTEEKDGQLYHAFGAYDSINYIDEDEEYNFDKFLEEIQKILPENEAFIYTEVGYEKLRYVSGFTVVVTSKEIKSTSLQNWAIKEAKQLLGNDFTTKMDY